jgi:hypothetical protein
VALAYANENIVLDGSKFCFPRTGAWHADLMIADELTPSGSPVNGRVRIVIGDGAIVLEGTADLGGAAFDMVRVRVVGGAGGLGKTATPKHYTDPTVRLVLTELLEAGGESLSDTASDDILDRKLAHWTTIGLPIRRVISRLMTVAAPDATWRVLHDGKIWIGVEEWNDSGLTENDYQIIDQADDKQSAVIGMETPTLQPGTRLASKKVSYVEYVLGENVRINAWFGDNEGDRFKAALSNAVKSAIPDIEYRVPYAAKVDAQGAGTVDIDPIGTDLVPTMAQVPLMLGAPGLTSAGASGGVVLVCWAGGDPSQPRAYAFDPDSRGGTLVWNYDQMSLGGEAGAEPATKSTIQKTSLDVFLLALDAYVTAIQAVADPSNLATPAMKTAIAALKTALPTWAATTTKVK